MKDQLNHVLSHLAHGLLTELPAEIAAAAIVAGAVGVWRYVKRRRAARSGDGKDIGSA
ncbi:hypothetical protein [Streptomyces adelaidensis]|uniref:hypothetical protein n=1 Tax=Streptomyces adelaidensis TaxID=2796465 RepID=UPI001903B20A|nr:hypothetical protein [Streptomyces adelaidensis]